jgi:hypothetical protein
MLRCDCCRGHAHAGLAHLHGTDKTLCMDCTRKFLAAREKRHLDGLFRSLSEIDPEESRPIDRAA